MQTGQFTAAKRGPNYNRITDKYPPRQVSRGQEGPLSQRGGRARGQAGPRGSAWPRSALIGVCQRAVPAPCNRKGPSSPGRPFLSGFSCRKTSSLPGDFLLIWGPLLFGCFSALGMKTLLHPTTSGHKVISPRSETSLPIHHSLGKVRILSLMVKDPSWSSPPVQSQPLYPDAPTTESTSDFHNFILDSCLFILPECSFVFFCLVSSYSFFKTQIHLFHEAFPDFPFPCLTSAFQAKSAPFPS